MFEYLFPNAKLFSILSAAFPTIKEVYPSFDFGAPLADMAHMQHIVRTRAAPCSMRSEVVMKENVVIRILQQTD